MIFTVKAILRCALAALSLLWISTGKAQFTYTLSDLGTLGGESSTASGLNASGQIVGVADTTDNEARDGFVTGTNGALPLRDLGSLGGVGSFAPAINATGRVAGTAPLSGDGPLHVFLSAANGGSLIDLGTLSGMNSYGYAVNGAGRVAGYSSIASGATHAFLSGDNGGALSDLGTLPGGTSSFAFGVNASGQVTGFSGTSDGSNHAFISESNGGALRDLGTLGGTFSRGSAINNAGQVVGRSAVSGVGQHAFRSAPNGGTLFDLGTLGGYSSFGEAINSAGTAVGYSFLSDNSRTHPFIYTTALGMRDLTNLIIPNASGIVMTSARAINDAGQIAGEGLLGSDTHAVLLTPILPKLTITNITRLGNGHLVVDGTGAPSQMHTVQGSSDLSQGFTDLATTMASSDGSLRYEDANLANAPRFFYRFVYP